MVIVSSIAFPLIISRQFTTYSKEIIFTFFQFHIHTEGCEVLEKYFPKAILPRDYGGKEDTSENLNGN